MENIIPNHDEINEKISMDFHDPHFTSYFTPGDDRSTDVLLYHKRTRICRRHLIDDETYWSARYIIEIPLDGFGKQEEKENEKVNEEK